MTQYPTPNNQQIELAAIMSEEAAISEEAERQASFLNLLCSIRLQRTLTREEIVSQIRAFPSAWQRIVLELFTAHQEDAPGSEERFWNTYYQLAGDYGELEIWRAVISAATPTDAVSLPDMQDNSSLIRQPGAHQSTSRDSFAPQSPKEPARETPEICFADLEARPLQWLWQDRISLGNLTLLDGDAGIGKSLLLYDLAARVSRGAIMPDGTPGLENPAGVVLISAAADPVTDASCLLWAGADLGRILAGNCMRSQKLSVSKERYACLERNFTLPDDLPYLAQYIDDTSAKLVIIDPVLPTFGKHSVHNDNAVYAVLLPLLHLVHEKEIACVLTRPLDPEPYQNPLFRGYGAVAFAAIAKSAMLLERDPDNNKQLLLTSTKNGFGELAPTLRLCIFDEPGSSLVHWQGEYKKPSSSPVRSQIRRHLEMHAPEMFTAPEIAGEFPEVPISTIRVRLRQMVDEGQIAQPVRGKYCSKSALN